MQRSSNLEAYRGQYDRDIEIYGRRGKKKVSHNFKKTRDHFRHPVDFYITYNPNFGMMGSDRPPISSISNSGRRTLEYSDTKRDAPSDRKPNF